MCAEYSTRRVLVADDEPLIADTVMRLIRGKFGCQVETAADGDEAAQKLCVAPFDLLLTDMLMPGLHGTDLVHKAREIAPNCAIMVMTAYPDEFPYVSVVKAGASDFLGKPYHPAELEAKIMRIFNEQDLRAQSARDKERILHDMAEMEKARKAQALAELKYQSLFELSMNGMALAEPSAYTITDANRAFCELSGRSKEEVLGVSMFDLIDPYERGRFQQGLSLLSTGGRGTLSDMILVRPSGRQVCLDVSVTFITVTQESFVLLAFKDVTEQREMQRQLTDIAQRDSLTGLLNKRTFQTRLDGAVTRARRQSERAVLMLIDLDNFKQCNDTFGHQIGDKLLSRVGELILKQMRGANDQGFRYGGDEFAVLVSNVAPEVAVSIGERIRGEFESGERNGTTMSIGIASWEPGMDVEALVRSADQALYKAKSAGKNTVCVA